MARGQWPRRGQSRCCGPRALPAQQRRATGNSPPSRAVTTGFRAAAADPVPTEPLPNEPPRDRLLSIAMARQGSSRPGRRGVPTWGCRRAQKETAVIDYAALEASIGQDWYALDPALRGRVREGCGSEDLPWAADKLPP